MILKHMGKGVWAKTKTNDWNIHVENAYMHADDYGGEITDNYGDILNSYNGKVPVITEV